MSRTIEIGYVHEICLLGRPIYMKYTLPSSVYVERPAEFSIRREAGGYVAEIVFDIVGSDGDVFVENTKIGEIHGYLLNVDRMECDDYKPKDEFCNGDDVSEIYWDMHDGCFGSNEKSKNIFYLDRVTIDKQYRHNKIATFSILMIPRVLYEQFNVAIGYLVAKSCPILDKPKLQKKDAEIYQRLCDTFWTRLGFLALKSYKYYNTTNNFLEENLARLSDRQCTELLLFVGDYQYCCDVKVSPDSRMIHIMEYSSAPYFLEDSSFPILQDQVLKELQLDGSAAEWKWVFYNHLGKVREFMPTGFMAASTRDDVLYVRMLNYYGYFVEQL